MRYTVAISLSNLKQYDMKLYKVSSPGFDRWCIDAWNKNSTIIFRCKIFTLPYCVYNNSVYLFIRFICVGAFVLRIYFYALSFVTHHSSAIATEKTTMYSIVHKVYCTYCTVLHTVTVPYSITVRYCGVITLDSLRCIVH